jgi:hypothetical protein
MLHFTCLSPLPYRREGDVHYILVHHSWLYRLACPHASRTHTGSLSEALLLFKEEVKTPQNKGIQKSEINDEQPYSTRDRGLFSLSEALLLFNEEVKTPKTKGKQKSESND